MKYIPSKDNRWVPSGPHPLIFWQKYFLFVVAKHRNGETVLPLLLMWSSAAAAPVCLTVLGSDKFMTRFQSRQDLPSGAHRTSVGVCKSPCGWAAAATRTGCWWRQKYSWGSEQLLLNLIALQKTPGKFCSENSKTRAACGRSSQWKDHRFLRVLLSIYIRGWSKRAPLLGYHILSPPPLHAGPHRLGEQPSPRTPDLPTPPARFSCRRAPTPGSWPNCRREHLSPDRGKRGTAAAGHDRGRASGQRLRRRRRSWGRLGRDSWKVKVKRQPRVFWEGEARPTAAAALNRKRRRCAGPARRRSGPRQGSGAEHAQASAGHSRSRRRGAARARNRTRAARSGDGPQPAAELRAKVREGREFGDALGRVALRGSPGRCGGLDWIGLGWILVLPRARRGFRA